MPPAGGLWTPSAPGDPTLGGVWSAPTVCDGRGAKQMLSLPVVVAARSSDTLVATQGRHLPFCESSPRREGGWCRRRARRMVVGALLLLALLCPRSRPPIVDRLLLRNAFPSAGLARTEVERRLPCPPCTS